MTYTDGDLKEVDEQVGDYFAQMRHKLSCALDLLSRYRDRCQCIIAKDDPLEDEYKKLLSL